MIHRIEGGGDRGRSPEHLTEQLEGVRVAAGGDGPHVPDHQALGLELGSPHQQAPALAVLGGDGLEHVLVDEPLQEFGQRLRTGRGVDAARVQRHLHPAVPSINILIGDRGVGLLQPGVILRPEEGEDRDEGPGADAGHQLEARPGARRRPAAQNSRAEGAVAAAAGQGQEVRFGLELAVIGGQFLLDRLNGALLQVFTVDVAPVPDAGQAGHLDLVQEVLRQRMAYLKRHAALEE